MFFQVLRFKRGQRELICQLSYDLASYKWPPLSLNLHKSIRWVNRSVVHFTFYKELWIAIFLDNMENMNIN